MNVMVDTVNTTLLSRPKFDTLSVDNVRNRQRGTGGKGARQLASLSSVDENALSSAKQTNTEDKDSASEEETDEEIRWVNRMTTDE